MFSRASKKEAKLRLALIGPSGSGKTYTALTLATHLVTDGRIAVIDTERGSASKYADIFAFDVQELESFHPQQYIEAIGEAQAAGYDVLIIDSLSHAWIGKDGALELVDRAAKRAQNGNSFAAWRDVTPLHNALVDAMLATRLHIIVTMRSKMEYVQDKDEKGKTVIRKVGLQPVQRDGLEYEFDVVGDMDIDNTLIVTKTRCSALSGAVMPRPGKELAQVLSGWLAGEPQVALAGPTILTPEVLGTAQPSTNGSGENPVTSVRQQGPSGNGNGHNVATIKTSKWAAAAKALTERCPVYAKENGQPDWYRLTEIAAECEFSDITETNLDAVIAALERYAEQNSE